MREQTPKDVFQPVEPGSPLDQLVTRERQASIDKLEGVAWDAGVDQELIAIRDARDAAQAEVAALSARCTALEQERDHLQEELGIHVDLTIEPFTEAELAQVDALRAKMRRTVEEYDITKAVERAERAEAERDEAIKGRDEADAIIARYGFGNAELTIKNLESRCQHLGQAVKEASRRDESLRLIIKNLEGMLKTEDEESAENRVSFAAGYTAALDDALKGTK